MANLVQNAVEHNDDGGHVAIKLSVFDEGKCFQLLVVDDGPGLPDEAFASLQSDSFIHDDARTRGRDNKLTPVTRRADGQSTTHQLTRGALRSDSSPHSGSSTHGLPEPLALRQSSRSLSRGEWQNLSRGLPQMCLAPFRHLFRTCSEGCYTCVRHLFRSLPTSFKSMSKKVPLKCLWHLFWLYASHEVQRLYQ